MHLDTIFFIQIVSKWTHLPSVEKLWKTVYWAQIISEAFHDIYYFLCRNRNNIFVHVDSKGYHCRFELLNQYRREKIQRRKIVNETFTVLTTYNNGYRMFSLIFDYIFKSSIVRTLLVIGVQCHMGVLSIGILIYGCTYCFVSLWKVFETKHFRGQKYKG